MARGGSTNGGRGGQSHSEIIVIEDSSNGDHPGFVLVSNPLT